MDEIVLRDAKLIALTGTNYAAVNKFLGVEDATGNYVVYCPLSHEKPEDDWLLDIRLYSEEYRADLISNCIRHIVMILYRSGCIVRMQTGTLLSVLYHDCIKTFKKVCVEVILRHALFFHGFPKTVIFYHFFVCLFSDWYLYEVNYPCKISSIIVFV